METTSRKTQCPVSKILKRYIKELKLTALLVLTKWTFSTWRICFHFLGNPLLCAIVWWVNKNFLSWRLSNDCQIARPALVSGSPNWRKPYNKHLISLGFSVRTANYGSPFFSIDLWPAREKNSVRNLQYGPKTRLLRGIYIYFMTGLFHCVRHWVKKKAIYKVYLVIVLGIKEHNVFSRLIQAESLKTGDITI